MPSEKVSLSEYGSSDLRSPRKAKRNVAAMAELKSAVTTKLKAISAILIILPRTLAVQRHKTRIGALGRGGLEKKTSPDTKARGMRLACCHDTAPQGWEELV